MSSVLFQGGSYNRQNQGRAEHRRLEAKVVDLEKKIESLEFVIQALQRSGGGGGGRRHVCLLRREVAYDQAVRS